MGRIILNNEEYTGSSGSAPVTDVTVNGSSVVNAQGVAEVITSDRVAKSGDTMTGGLNIARTNTTTSTIHSTLELGNDTPDGTAGCTYGRLIIYSTGSYSARIMARNLTARRDYDFPDNSGTLALTSDTLDPKDNTLSSSADLDTIKTVGFYKVGGGNSVTNKPSGVGAFGLTVVHDAGGDYYTQILYDPSNKKTYIRYCSNGTWGAWSVLALTSDVDAKVSKSGDTMSGNLTVDRQNGTTSATAWSAVVLGNNTPSGTDKNSFGVVRLYGENQAYTDLYAPNTTTQNRDITFPNKNGTVALTSDIPNISTKVSKSGDTMTGALQIDDVTSSIKINRSNSSSYSGWIDFYNQNGFRGGFTVNNYKKPYFSDGTYYEELAYVSSLSSYIPKFSNSVNSAIATCRGGGSAYYFKIATVTETQTNSDFPIMFELSQRSGDFVNLTMEVSAGTLIYFKVNGAGNYYVNYDGNNVWTIYGKYDSGSWGVATLTRVAGLGTFERHDIVINMENVSSIPSGAVQATHGDSFTNDVTVQGTLTAYNFMNLYSDTFDKQVTISLPTSLTANRNVSFPNKGGTIAMTSDISSRRYKENIIPLSEDEAKKILDVEIVNYDYKENVVDEDERYDQKGAIAEDVVNLIPNAVTYADIDGEQLPDGINYTKFIPYLIKMVQMQQKEIEELKAMIKGASK